MRRKLSMLNQEIEKLRISLQQESEKSSLLSQLNAARTTRSKLLSSISDLKQQVMTMNPCHTVHGDKVQKGRELQSRIDFTILEIEKRKRIAKEMLSDISEQSGISVPDLIGDLGLEMNSTIRGA